MSRFPTCPLQLASDILHESGPWLGLSSASHCCPKNLPRALSYIRNSHHISLFIIFPFVYSYCCLKHDVVNTGVAWDMISLTTDIQRRNDGLGLEDTVSTQSGIADRGPTCLPSIRGKITSRNQLITTIVVGGFDPSSSLFIHENIDYSPFRPLFIGRT